MHLRQCTSAQLRHLQARDRALQGGLGPRVSSRLSSCADRRFSARSWRLELWRCQCPWPVPRIRQARSARYCSRRQSRRNEDVLILAVDPIAQIADFQGREHGDVLQHPESPSTPGQTAISTSALTTVLSGVTTSSCSVPIVTLTLLMSRYPDMQTILHRHVLKISRCAHKIHFVPWAAPDRTRPKGQKARFAAPLSFPLAACAAHTWPRPAQYRRACRSRLRPGGHTRRPGCP